MFLSIHRWYHSEEIFSLCRICALSRKDGEREEMLKHAYFLMERYGAGCEVLQNEVVDISSTEVRKAIECGEAEDYVPHQVLQYITSKGFYHGSST